MLAVLKYDDGTIYAARKGDGPIFAEGKSDRRFLTVDEVIEFLEPFRGLKFYNSATENTSFRVKDGVVACDELDYWTDDIEDLSEAFCIENFFYEYLREE